MASSDSIKPRDVCIVGVARTPMGGFLGSLSSFTATKLGSIAIQCALQRANIDPSLVQEVFFGNVLSANLGQAPARQAALGAGIPNSVICTTINKVCASGMKATMLAAQTIQLGINDVVVAGGMESMSNAPKYLADARKGSRLGHDTIVDGMMKDGLWDVYNDFGMGVCAEICADQHSIIRDDQDSYAIQSFERGIAAQNSGHFSWEVVPVEVSGGRGKPSTIVDKDDGLGKFDAAKLRKLRPSFKENGGSVTAGNASSISDGAAALVLMSGEKALKLRLQVIAKIRGYADAAQAPELFTTAPALAIPKAISNAGLEASQVDFYEINEAFSVVALANQKLLGLNPKKVNAHGGAVSLGHPLGCSGARILVTLLGVLKHKNGKYGVGGICNGGGGASALVLELIDGAAALVPMSGEKALKLGLQVIAKIRGYADAAQAPELFTTAPALAIPKAISNAGLEASQIDFCEINEAFSVVALANQKLLGLNPQKVKAHGGAVSLGHPLGCSGARILVTLLGVTYIVAYSYLLWVCFFPYGLSEHCCVIYLSLNPHLCMFGFSVGYKVSL
ncbi:acetyl-CoA acetyltransferase 2 isoform X1 [Populus alba]|uniref:acetyl-CoA acetyltransferase 2 isoform X1 n=1 Tax=Populus alba TaxID=43335 RepID=UPI003CC70AC1